MAKGKVEYWLTSDGLTLLSGWAREGLTDKQISNNMNISRSTLNEWKKKYSDISDTLKKGKEIVDYEVENALLKRAKGYTYEEITEECVFDKTTETYGMKVTKRVTKEVAPDVGAAMAWLKNRRPDKWRDKPQNDSDEKDEGVVIINDCPKFEKE